MQAHRYSDNTLQDGPLPLLPSPGKDLLFTPGFLEAKVHVDSSNVIGFQR